MDIGSQPFALTRQFGRFCAIGAMGFLVDSGTFSLLYYLAEYPAVESRMMAFFIAAISTWLGNRYLTFQLYSNPIKQFLRYLFVATLALVPNLAVFYWWIMAFGEHGIQPLIGVCLGVASGLVVNFTLGKIWVFKVRG